MQRFSLSAFAMFVILSAQTMGGCGSPSDNPGNSAAQSVRADIESATTPIYALSVTMAGQSRTAKVRPSDGLNTQVMQYGYNGLVGAEAVQAVLADVAQRSADEGSLANIDLNNDTLVIDANLRQKSATPAVSGTASVGQTPNATCVNCWDVYRCTSQGCYYVGTICRVSSC